MASSLRRIVYSPLSFPSPSSSFGNCCSRSSFEQIVCTRRVRPRLSMAGRPNRARFSFCTTNNSSETSLSNKLSFHRQWSVAWAVDNLLGRLQTNFGYALKHTLGDHTHIGSRIDDKLNGFPIYCQSDSPGVCVLGVLHCPHERCFFDFLADGTIVLG